MATQQLYTATPTLQKKPYITNFFKINLRKQLVNSPNKQKHKLVDKWSWERMDNTLILSRHVLNGNVSSHAFIFLVSFFSTFGAIFVSILGHGSYANLQCCKR